MATFEDSGKCKGFAFIDFKDDTGPTTALKSRVAQKLINRKLRLEYGEDRSKRNPNMKRKSEDGEGEGEVRERKRESSSSSSAYVDEQVPQREPRPAKKRVFRERKDDGNKRMKSSVALATAQRASAAIVQSTGKKIKFD